ncbi:MAG TPA: alpha/beta hydrolase [Anaerolineae bacterium]
MTTGTLTLRNNRFYYRVMGQGMPIVLVHGHNHDGDDFAAIADNLARHWRVLVPDLRFHGASEGALLGHPARIADLAQDLHAILQALDFCQPVMLGHSLGGMIALDYWRQYPGSVRALVLEDSFPHFQTGSDLLGGLFAPGVDSELRARIMAKSEANEAGARVPESVWQSILDFNAKPWLPSINVPTLALQGDRGQLGPGALQHALEILGTAQIPNVRVVSFKQCGHFIALEQPVRYCAVLREFLSALPE